MENKNIIIILLVIIVILAVAIGFLLFNPTVAKEPTKIKITSDKEQYEGGKLSIKLTDLNKTPISKEIVNITITNKKGKVVVDDVVKTNSKGNAKIDLDLKKGKYKVIVSYGGNENFTGNNTTQKLTIKEEVVEQPVTQQSTSSYYGDSSSNQNDNRPAVDSSGITREEADKYGWTYTSDHGGHYIGSNDHWDENAGVYHD